MKNIFFTVGPSQLYPTVPNHLKNAIAENIPSLSHRSVAFKEMNKATHQKLRKLLNIPPTHHIFYTGSALEAMERVIQNTVYKHSAHFVNGSFSREFYQIALDYKKKAVRFDAPNGEGFDFAKIKLPKKSEVVCFVHNETSTGVALNLEKVYDLKVRYPDKLFAIDIVSSAPYVQPDFSHLDIVFFSIQKGFGLPAGLGVMIVSEKALEKALWLENKNVPIGSYHNFLKLREFEESFQTRETPNVLAIYLLGKVVQDMLDAGIENIRQEIDKRAETIYTFFENHKEFKPFVSRENRSQTTIVINVEGKSEAVVKRLEKLGFIVAKGYGKRKDMHIRIGNFPAHSQIEVKRLLSAFI